MGKLLLEPETASSQAAFVMAPAERVRPGSTRLPPAKKGEYLVLKRGRVIFSVRSTDATGIRDLDRLIISDKQEEAVSGAGKFNESILNLIDVGWALAPRDGSQVNSPGEQLKKRPLLYVTVGTSQSLHLAVDEIVSLRAQGVERIGEPLGVRQNLMKLGKEMPPTRLLQLSKQTVPLLDEEIVNFWGQDPDNILTVDCPQRSTFARAGGLMGRDRGVDGDHERWADEILSKIHWPEKRKAKRKFPYALCVVGGLGHVGLPLGIAFAEADLKVMLYDINEQAVETVSRGRMPFKETGAEESLGKVLGGKLKISRQRHVIEDSHFVVVVIGTPVDEHLNPRFSTFQKFFDDIIDLIHDDQHIILRSTVYPGTTEKVKKYLESQGKKTRVSFCPERIVQGEALRELHTMPQIVSSFDEPALQEVTELFLHLTEDVVSLAPIEAELGKLFCNVWRYTQFAISNQFYQIATQNNLDFYKIYRSLTAKYPRLDGLSTPGFTAGPCLFKDTMQLAAFSNNSFFLGHAAMLINEGLPNFLIQKLREKYPLGEMTVGILGMAFKADNDDKRESLSYKLKKMLEIEAESVLCSDVYINEPDFVDPDELISRSDVIILGTPHREYRNYVINEDKILVDVWNYYGQGGLF